MVDAIDQLPDVDATQINGVFGEIPLRDFVPFSQELSGTLSIAAGSTSVSGVGTSFTTELVAGEIVQLDGREFTVDSVLSDTAFVVRGAALSVTPIDNAIGRTNPVLGDDNYVFVDISVQ